MDEPKVSTQSSRTSGTESSAPETRTSLKDARLIYRTDALFRASSSDYLLREQFVSDPARTFADYVTDERVSDDVAETANQLLYAVVSSPRLAKWLNSYARRLKSTVPSRQAFATHLAQAIATSGDDIAVLALIHAASRDRDHFSLQADLLRAVVVALGVFRQVGSGTESTPGPGPGTEQTPGPGGTEHSLGGRFSITEMTRVLEAIQRVMRGNPGVFSSGTESTPGPGPGTEQTPGPGGTEHSLGGRFSMTEMTRVLEAIQRVMRGNSGVFSSGTESTPGPGPGTEQTPGPGGTEHSLGGRFSITEMTRVLEAIQRVMRGNPGVFSSGTESTPGPGPGTEQTPGPGGTEHSLGGRFSITEMTRVLEAIQRVMRGSPGVFSSGTESTPGPGPGTEQTPGPGGTEHSLGAIFHGLGYVGVTMEALTRYATQLRANNALSVSGVEGR